MKKFLIIAILAIASISLSAQSYVEPPELTFQDMRFVKGMSKDTIAERVRTWYHSKDDLWNNKREGIHYDSDRLHYVITDCPNFGVSKFLGGSGTLISFYFTIVPMDEYYIARVYHISSDGPNIFCYYGANGELFPECYNNRQLKLAKPLLKYIFERSQLIFDEFAAYMGAE